MSTEIRVYDQAPGDPVVVMVTSGTYDVSRLALLLHKGRCEESARADYIRRALKRHSGGRAALALLRDHGGPDLLEDVTVEDRERGELRAEVDRLRAKLSTATTDHLSHAAALHRICDERSAAIDRLTAERNRYAAALDKLGARIHRDLHVESSYVDLGAADPQLHAALIDLSTLADECLSVLDRTETAATSTDPQRPDEPAPTAN